jgi:hypothetical protein
MILTILILIVGIGILWSKHQAQEKRINLLIASIDEKNKQFDDLYFQYLQYKNLYLSSETIKLTPAIYIPPGKKNFNENFVFSIHRLSGKMPLIMETHPLWYTVSRVKTVFLIILLTIFFLVLPIHLSVEAHPGRTDSSGSHTCRTNCESWGLGYGEYHYHGGGGSSGGSTESTNTAPVIESNQLESSQRFMEYRNTVLTGTPTNIPTRIPTRRPTRMPSPTATGVPSPTAEPALLASPIGKAKPELANVQPSKPQGFFEWLFSLFGV